MPVFEYEALQAGGGKTSGELEASSRQEAFGKLRQQNLQPFKLAAKGAAAAAAAPGGGAPATNVLTRPQVLLFTEELCELLEAGLKLDRALQVIEQRQDKSALRHVAASARQSLREGATFSAARCSAKERPRAASCCARAPWPSPSRSASNTGTRAPTTRARWPGLGREAPSLPLEEGLVEQARAQGLEGGHGVLMLSREC
jgi:hypothetical protein